MSAAVVTLGLGPLVAADITYKITGTLGPVLAGSDPVGADGRRGAVTMVVNEKLRPKRKTKTSATYSLPPGAVKVVLAGSAYATSGPSKVELTVPAAGPDTIVCTTAFVVEGIKVTVVGTVSLAKGSFTSAVLKHPEKFTPSPQTLAAATTAGGAGSTMKYSLEAVGSTTLGLTGSASN